ncbi:MAG TPA: hypothetical protein VFS25_20335 [Chitinophaga sp.]|uniref:hypothetical protein n=1 Tax=Chitinophaga sp. TaxID=1869181 RepID=UPI002DB85CC3|nr:hypothetical protein [Chitinophaga sp.]HEU4555210.1 hypothetical protein [Chitinophaga sp.]
MLGHVTAGMCAAALLLYSSRAGAQSQSSIDTILTTKGAATLITCGAAVSTFQIGDGKNADYDYRIVDRNLVFIRPTAATPRTTNLIVREGSNVHYLILAYRDKADLSQLKYTLSAKAGAALNPTATPEAKVVTGSDGKPVPVVTEDEGTAAAAVNIDTVTVSKIADDFGKQQKAGHQHETKVGGVTLSFSNAMLLNNLIYFCYHLRNRSQQPYNLVKAALMYKDNKTADRLYTMPILYKKAPATVNRKDEQQLVYVVPARALKRNDEVVIVLQNNADQRQLVLYTPINALPKYMVQ